MKYRHAHPINILEMTSRYLVLLLLPILQTLVMAVLAVRAEVLFSWFLSVLTTLCTVGIILLLGIWRWYCFTFAYNQHGIYARRGVLLRRQWSLAFEQMTTVVRRVPWYLRPFCAVHLQADSNGGNRNIADFSVTVASSVADDLMLLAQQPTAPASNPVCYQPSIWSVLAFSLLHSNALTGTVYLLLAAGNLYQVIGVDLTPLLVDQVGQLVTLLQFIPPLVALIFVLLAIPFCYSVLRNFWRCFGFAVARDGNRLALQSGLFTRHKALVACPQINALLFKQGVVTGLFGIGSAWIVCAGLGDKTAQSSLLLPSTFRATMEKQLQHLLPAWQYTTPTIRPKKSQLGRFLGAPVLTLLGIWLGVFGLCHWFPRFYHSVLALGVLATLPAVWWLCCRGVGFFYTGLGGDQTTLTCRYTHGFELIEARVPRHKISKITVHQNLFQRLDGSCHLCLHLKGKRPYRIKIKNLPFGSITQTVGKIRYFAE